MPFKKNHSKVGFGQLPFKKNLSIVGFGQSPFKKNHATVGFGSISSVGFGPIPVLEESLNNGVRAVPPSRRIAQEDNSLGWH